MQVGSVIIFLYLWSFQGSILVKAGTEFDCLVGALAVEACLGVLLDQALEVEQVGLVVNLGKNISIRLARGEGWEEKVTLKKPETLNYNCFSVLFRRRVFRG